jgi:3'(2'), 5'-bisphosphate nucleotidase
MGDAMSASDTLFAERIAEEAGAALMALRAAGRLSGPVLGAEGDRIANRILCDAIGSERPDDALLSEEEKDSADRLSASRVWIVDPLDGTREYAQGRDDWAVHVALAVDGVAVIGAVGLPARGLILSSGAPPVAAPAGHPPRMLVSRTRPAEEALRVAAALGADIVPMGSAGAKAMAVVLGEADIYLHTGGQYEWDNAAPVAVAVAAGLHVSRVDGSAIRYNAANPYLPDLLICRPEWRDRVFQALV